MKKTLYTILFLLLGGLYNLQAAQFLKISTATIRFGTLSSLPTVKMYSPLKAMASRCKPTL